MWRYKIKHTEREGRRERERAQGNYIGSYYKPRVVQSIALHRDFFYNLTDYKLFKHINKRLPLLNYIRKRLIWLNHTRKRLLQSNLIK